MLDQYFGDAKKLGTVMKIRLCRRLLATIVTISSRSLNKPDLQRPEALCKMLEVGNDYIRQWHQSLAHFIVRTNQKFEQYSAFLDELSGSSDDDNKLGPELISRRNSRTMNNSRVGTPVVFRSTARTDKQSNLLVQMFKNPDSNMTDVPHENTFVDEPSNIIGEEMSRSDLNGIEVVIIHPLILIYNSKLSS